MKLLAGVCPKPKRTSVLDLSKTRAEVPRALLSLDVATIPSHISVALKPTSRSAAPDLGSPHYFAVGSRIERLKAHFMSPPPPPIRHDRIVPSSSLSVLISKHAADSSIVVSAPQLRKDWRQRRLQRFKGHHVLRDHAGLQGMGWFMQNARHKRTAARSFWETHAEHHRGCRTS